MRSRLLLEVVGIIALLCVGQQARAGLTTVNPNSAGEPDLFAGLSPNGNVLDALYRPNNYVRIDDSSDQIWQTTGGPVVVTPVAKYAGDDSELMWRPNGQSSLPLFDTSVTTSAALPSSAQSAQFTWELDNLTTGDVWSSIPANNTADDGTDHMVTFLITSGPSSGSYVIAWEDLSQSKHSDYDYQDAVIQVTGAEPVPPGVIKASAASSVPEPVAWVVWVALGSLALGHGWRRGWKIG
jgi:hypothetical protein